MQIMKNSSPIAYFSNKSFEYNHIEFGYDVYRIRVCTAPLAYINMLIT